MECNGICIQTDYSVFVAGFVSCLCPESSSRALDAVGDVLGSFLSRMCKLLRVNMDHFCQQGGTDGSGFEV